MDDLEFEDYVGAGFTTLFVIVGAPIWIPLFIVIGFIAAFGYIVLWTGKKVKGLIDAY